jgi:hypothetical protein
MIEVRLELWDAVERGMFNSFVDVLEAQRDQAEAERERKWALAAADAGRDSADVRPSWWKSAVAPPLTRPRSWRT